MEDIKIQFRNCLEEYLQTSGLQETDYEEVETNLFYSRGVRTLCVIDAVFDKEVTHALQEFLPSVIEGEEEQLFMTSYGLIHLYINNDGLKDCIEVSLTIPEQNVGQEENK